MSDKLFKVGLEFKALDTKSPHSVGRIAGWASTNEIDSYNEIVEPTAFNEAMADYMKHPIVLFGHDWYSKPIGKVVDYRIDSSYGLYVEAEIADTVEGRDVWTLIRFEILKAFSIGFWTLEREDPNDKNQPSRIKKLRLAEISVVNVPANAASLFEQAKSLELSTTIKQALSDGVGAQRKESGKMPELNIESKLQAFEQQIGGFKSSLDLVTGDLEKMKKNAEQAERMLQAFMQKQADERNGLCTKAELDSYAQKMGADLLVLQEENRKLGQARKENALKVPFIEWKKNPLALVTHLDDQGRPLSELQQKAFAFFHTPVDYKTGGEEGRILKAAREAHDCLVVMAALKQQGKFAGNLMATKTAGLLRELTGYLDPEFSKAMYSTGTGLGDEWVNTGWSQELYDLVRIEAVVEGLFPSFPMPTQSYIWPIKTSGASLYYADEATTNNPATLRQSNFGTSNVTFTALKYAVAISASPEFVEDSIIQVVNEIRKETATAAALGYDSIIVNADTAATHQDNASATRWNTYEGETKELGLRARAFDDSKTFDTQSTSTGVGDATAALAADDFRYARALLGVYGRNPKECAYIVPLTTYFKMLGFTPLTQGQLYFMKPGTWESGELTLPFDGCRVAVTSAIDTNQAATGLYTDGVTSSTYTSIICANTTGAKVGVRQGFTLEFEKNILTQQWSFVTTMRKCFKFMAPSGKYPVSVGIKVAS